MNWFVDLLDDLIADGGEVSAEKIKELREARIRLAAAGSALPRCRATNDLVTALDEVETLDQLAAVFANVPREYGFDGATLMVLKEGQRCLSRRVISTLPDAWWDDYHAQNLSEGDPLIDGILAQEHELYLDELIPSYDAPLRYLRCAEAHHIGCNGVIFKIGYPSGLLAAMVLNTVRQPDYARRQFRKYRDDLYVVSQAVCDGLVHFSRIGVENAAQLTPEEIHFLRLVSKSEDPSQALTMTCRYGSAKTIQNQIIRKLGVQSIFQAVFLAAHEGLLDNALLHPEEIVRTNPQITGWDLLNDEGALSG